MTQKKVTMTHKLEMNDFLQINIAHMSEIDEECCLLNSEERAFGFLSVIGTCLGTANG
jgi:hypothetical protein